MDHISRTAKSLKNAKVALCFYFINLILQFFSRKYFLDYLGAEVLGLNTTAQNLLGFLNIAELGIGSAVSYILYKPLFSKDIQVINEIVSVQGWLYRKVAYIVITGACILMLFFPLIFKKTEFALWYTYATFIVLLIGALLGYFVNYRQIVLTADQKEYKITINVQGYKLLKVILQIVVIIYLNNGYIYWLVIELLMSGVVALALDRLLRREYPWLKACPQQGKRLRNKYRNIIIKTKQVFFHQIATFVLLQTSPLIIYAFTTLTAVAIYGNYMLIVSGVTLLINALLNSVNAGVGNLVAEGNKVRIKIVFWELTSLRIWLASIICFCIYKLGSSFVTLWVGHEYVINQYAFLVIILTTFISLTRTNDTFLYAYGLYQDIWAPIIEAILNLGLSIMLGYYYGLTGILSGVFISLFLIVFCWKPYFLFKKGFKENISEYVLRYSQYIVLLFASYISSSFIINICWKKTITNCWLWIEYAVIIFILYTIISLVLFVLFDFGFRALLRRLKILIK